MFQSFANDDLEELIAMMSQLYGSGFDEAAARKGLALITAGAGSQPPGRIWLIKVDGRTAGYMLLTTVFSLEFGGWAGLLDELFLREEFRGRGWGTKAIDLAATTCREMGISTLLLEVDVTNSGALRLYERCGFREHTRRLMRRSVRP